MKTRSKITALLTLILMLLMQVPQTAFAADTDIRADLLEPISNTLKNGRVEEKYNVNFNFDYSQFNNGFMAYSWSIPEEDIPPGLELAGQYSTWEPTLMGTPTTAGTYTFTIEGGRTVYENGENVYIIAARKTYTLTILPTYSLEIENYAIYSGRESDSYNVTFYEDHSYPVTWSASLENGRALPEGLTIDAESGKLNWENPVAGKYNLKITATRDEETVSKVYKLIIEPGDGCKHQNATKVEGKAATCQENGLPDYWYCNICEQYFLNKQCKMSVSSDGLENLYTIGFHSDNGEGICAICGKTMPIFKKVTNEDEITSGGMYLVVANIDDKYYTFKAPESLNYFIHGIEATEIEQNSDKTFSYPSADKDVMVLESEFAAECGSLDAGLPRYSFGTKIYGIPHSISSDDYAGSFNMYANEDNKYGYRMTLDENGNLLIASVYSEYWGGGEAGNTDVLTAFKGTRNGETERFFSFKTKEAYENDGFYTGYDYEYYDDNSLSTYKIELYKLTYTGKTDNNNSYEISDAQSTFAFDTGFTVIGSEESKISEFNTEECSSINCSVVGGISGALNAEYWDTNEVKEVTSNINGNFSAKAYANISLKSEEIEVNEWGQSVISSLVYNITPMLEINGNKLEISDDYLNGSGMTVSLCVGDMYDVSQIIHHKSDGTKEYFYSEYSAMAKNGAKSFKNDMNYSEKGNFVTFTIDSFSDIEILATAQQLPITEGDATITVPVAGQTPSFEAVSRTPSLYSVELIRWIDCENQMDIYPSDLENVNSDYYNYKFEAGKQYEAVVKFTAADGYELSYTNNFTINGNKTYYTINGLNRTYIFTAEDLSTSTVVNGDKFTVTGNHIGGYNVILALYNNKNELVDCQSEVYSGGPIPFITSATDFTSAKVMVWDKFTNIKPVTEVENVTIGQNN